MAHEVGHLVLPVEGHAEEGIMRATVGPARKAAGLHGRARHRHALDYPGRIPHARTPERRRHHDPDRGRSTVPRKCAAVIPKVPQKRHSNVRS